ncbi:MAG: hypothetical protein HVN34_12915, partial [Methanobacteriaceae archaeon]|nr:hypothetical protein [Methanobacteriaceae archaeon]
ESRHQPVALLKLAAYLKNIGVEAKLFNFLATPHGGRVRRELVNKIKVNGFEFRKYRIGATKTEFYRTLKEYQNLGWVPQEMWMTTLTTYWWPGLLEASEIALRVFPNLKIKIGGLYPTLFSSHAANQFNTDIILEGSEFHNLYYNGDPLVDGSTVLVTGNIPQVCLLRPDYSILPNAEYGVFQVRCGPLKDYSGGEFLLPGGRHQFKPVSEIFNDIVHWNEEFGISHFTCYDDKIACDDKGYTLKLLLRNIISNKLKIKLHFFNGLYPEDIDCELAELLKEAGTLEIYFMPSLAETDEKRNSIYKTVATLLMSAGFKLRNLSVGGYFFVGAPGEDLTTILEKGLIVSHTLGFAIPVFYTPSPWTKNFFDISSTLDVDKLSPHLFPMKHCSPLEYRHYDEIMRLFAMLNYPVKNTTFDFWGEGRVPSVLRNLIRQSAYDNTLSAVIGSCIGEGAR